MMRRLRLSKLPLLSRLLEKKEKKKKTMLSEVAILKEVLTHTDFLREIKMNKEFAMQNDQTADQAAITRLIRPL